MQMPGDTMARIELLFLAGVDDGGGVCEIVSIANAVPQAVLEYDDYPGVNKHKTGDFIWVPEAKLHYR